MGDLRYSQVGYLSTCVTKNQLNGVLNERRAAPAARVFSAPLKTYLSVEGDSDFSREVGEIPAYIQIKSVQMVSPTGPGTPVQTRNYVSINTEQVDFPALEEPPISGFNAYRLVLPKSVPRPGAETRVGGPTGLVELIYDPPPDAFKPDENPWRVWNMSPPETEGGAQTIIVALLPNDAYELKTRVGAISFSYLA